MDKKEPPGVMVHMKSAQCKGQNFDIFFIYIPTICWKVVLVSKVPAIFYFYYIVQWGLVLEPQWPKSKSTPAK